MSSGKGVSPRTEGYAVSSWVASMFAAGVVSFVLPRVLNVFPGVG